MGLAFIICGIGVGFWALWVAWKVTKAGGVQPYQDSQLVQCGCNHDCRQGRDCDCYERSCNMTVQEYDNWPFPKERP